MLKVNGYSAEVLDSSIFSRLSDCTADAIQFKLDGVERTLNAEIHEIFISLGENCGAAFQMRGAGVETFGSNFFDNTVIRSNKISTIIHRQFSDILNLRHLFVDNWETHDSVIDSIHQIYFHHYFTPGYGAEKYHSDGITRRIDSEDIPLFLPVVRGQFEYLAAKFLMIARSSRKKNYIIRNVEGRAIPEADLNAIEYSLKSVGARNFSILQVISYLDGVPVSPRFGHWHIPEDGERWGAKAVWLAFAQGKDRGKTWT